MGLKLRVGIARFPYGGNGGVANETPEVGEWLTRVCLESLSDERIEQPIHVRRFTDTPITMTRNNSVLWAREKKLDVLIMVDSDMYPDHQLLERKDGKAFFSSSFDFLYEHYHKGPVCIAAPYMGVEPHKHIENCYIFQWRNHHSSFDFRPNEPQACSDFKLIQYQREEASQMSGIVEAGALPTGLIMYDMRCFDLTDPKHIVDKMVSQGEVLRPEHCRGWFYYEFPDVYAAQKISTEDVTQTRDLSIAGCRKLGYNPVFCNWDAWAGHWKPVCLAKPAAIDASYVSETLAACVNRTGSLMELTGPMESFDPTLPPEAYAGPESVDECPEPVGGFVASFDK